MYKIMLVIKNKELIEQISSLNILGEQTGFQISTISDDHNKALVLFKKHSCELVIAENSEGIALLKKARMLGLNIRTAFISTDKDFEAARQGIILGAYDYIAAPIDENHILAMLTRIKNEINKNEANDILYAERILSYFEKRDSAFYDYLDQLSENELNESDDAARAARRLKRIEEFVMSELFARYPWLDLYINEAVIKNEESVKNNSGSASESVKTRLSTIFSAFCELYPKHSPQIHDVIMTILNYPESDLRQKVISAQLHINSTYLSTVFIAQTNVRFVDYMNTVKLKRAAYMLLNTKFEIKEIADRLYYKDISYFSKLFKKKYGIVPSMFRIPSNYNFQI